jgi:hypothetical protein
MRKVLLTAFAVLFFASSVWGQQLQLGRKEGNLVDVVGTTWTALGISNARHPRSITVYNLDSSISLFVSLDESEPALADSTYYILPPSMEKTWWLQRASVKVRAASSTVGVGLGVAY